MWQIEFYRCRTLTTHVYKNRSSDRCNRTSSSFRTWLLWCSVAGQSVHQLYHCARSIHTMVETLTYHVFHVRRWREHPPPDFVVIIKNGQHVILADVAPFPYFGRGVRAVAVSRAEIGKIERGHCVDTCPQRTSPTRHAQQHDQ